jgi:nucleotide-binding universal stress UspA family protein
MALVVGTDLSEHSLDALRAAFAIAQRRGDAELVLVNVLDDEAARAASEAERDRLIAAARPRLEGAGARLAAGTGIRVRPEVRIGAADEALSELAEAEHAELVLIASRGQGATAGETRRLGRAAYQLALRARVPLLVVRDPAPLLAWATGERPLRVLVGVDESTPCLAAIQFVKALRRIGPVDIVVGHVYFPDEAGRRYGIRHVSMVEPMPEIEQLIARDILRQLGDVPGQGEILAQPRLGLGRIGDHLLELADAQAVDLVVVGTRRKSGLKRLSSVSAVVLEDASQSVVCAPLTQESALDQVPRVRVAVAATDRSSFANLAIPWAYGLVGDRGEVHIVHVVEQANDADDAAIVRELLELAPPSRLGVMTRAHVVHGEDAARTIAETAERVGADLVCLCSHGRSGLSRALVGSVTDKVMRAGHRPVLVLRPVE